MLSYFSGVLLFVTLWTVACQASLSMGFSRQECWSGLPCPPPGDLCDPGIELMSPVAPACRWILLPVESPGRPQGGPKIAGILKVGLACACAKPICFGTCYAHAPVKTSSHPWRCPCHTWGTTVCTGCFIPQRLSL